MIRVVDAIHFKAFTLSKVLELLVLVKMKRFHLLLRRPFAQLIEDVVSSLPFICVNNATLLQEIAYQISTYNCSAAIKLNLKELSESRRIVVSFCLGIPKGLQDRVHVDNALFNQVGTIERIS